MLHQDYSIRTKDRPALSCQTPLHAGEPQRLRRTLETVTVTVKSVFLIVAWTLWLLLGTLFWLGLMARTLAVFAGAFL